MKQITKILNSRFVYTSPGKVFSIFMCVPLYKREVLPLTEPAK